MEQVQSFIEEKIRLSDIKAILEAAEYDIDKIEYAYRLSQKATGIENLTGWLISAIKNGYEEPMSGKENMKIHFEQQELDLEMLEKALVEN